MSTDRRIKVCARLLPLLLIVALLAGCGAPHEFAGTVYDPIIPAPEIEGTNWDGSAFRLSDQQGKVTLIFFGYTFCPDICPTTLGTMKQVAAQLDAGAEDLAVVFVTVDPERDSPERLGVYTNAFDEDFFGVWLDDAALAQAKQDYGVYAEKRVLDESESSGDYFVDHTGWIYVIDREGQLREVFGTDAAVTPIVEDVRFLMERS
ncbi:MAG: SCO family protein [Caldilineaceae bacterium]